jgi:hypothetical protein
MKSRLAGFAKLTAGVLILVAAYVLGLRTRLFFNHVLFPLGFWLVFDAIDEGITGKSYLRRLGTGEGIAMMALAGLVGVILDYHMVVLTGILRFYAIRTPFTALQMYVGWAFCLPAIYESYTVVGGILAKHADKPVKRPPPKLGALRLMGLLLLTAPIFSAMWMGYRPGWLLLSSFTGMFLLMEYVQWRRGRTPLLWVSLRGEWRPWTAMILASLPYTILWEGLNGMIGSWDYTGIFWLEPRIWNIPLVAFFGYLFWYVLFLSLLGAVGERDARVWEPDGRDA